MATNYRCGVTCALVGRVWLRETAQNFVMILSTVAPGCTTSASAAVRSLRYFWCSGFSSFERDCRNGAAAAAQAKENLRPSVKGLISKQWYDFLAPAMMTSKHRKAPGNFREACLFLPRDPMAETVQGITQASQNVSSPAPLHRLMTRETPGRAARAVGRAETLQPFFNYARQCRGTNCGRRDIITGRTRGSVAVMSGWAEPEIWLRR